MSELLKAAVDDEGRYTLCNATFYNINDFNEFGTYGLNDGYGKYFTIKLDLSNYGDEEYSKIRQLVKKLCGLNYEVKVNINAIGMNFTEQDFDNFIDFEDELKQVDAQFHFSEYSKEFTIEETLNAYVKAKEFIDHLKSSEFTPLEKYIAIYNYVSSFAYNGEMENSMTSRTIIGTLNSDEIVCVGYSELLKYMCESVGIECKVQMCSVEDNGQLENHQNNIVYIKDEKYGVDSWFYADSCWDAIEKHDEPFTKYNFCLIPFADVSKMKNCKIISNDYQYLYIDKKDEKIEYEDMRLSWSKSDCIDVMEQIGLEYKREKLDALLENEKIFENRFYKAIKFVRELFEIEKIPTTVYEDVEECPAVFMPSKFISYCMLTDFDKEAVMQHVKDFKKFYNEKVNGNNLYPSEEEDEERYYDIEVFIENDIYGLFDELEDNVENELTEFLFERIVEDYECYENIESVKNYLMTLKLKSSPVSIETLEMAIKNTWIKQGMSLKEAEVKTKRAIEKSEKRSEECFNENAINCFRLEQLKLRQKSSN